MLECFKEGLYWRGIMHDWHKFRPCELIPYINFFDPNKKHAATVRDKTGYYKPTDTGDKAFDRAWLLHQKIGRHHWQWWILPEDEGGIKVLDMEQPYLTEMLCDWSGAGRAQKAETSVAQWYNINKHKMQLSEKTKNWLEREMNLPKWNRSRNGN